MVPEVVWTVATRDTPSVPGCRAMIRPNLQYNGCEGSLIKTRSPTLNCFSSSNHLFRNWRQDKYSFFHRAQKKRWMSVTNRQRCIFEKGTLSKHGSGRAVVGSRVRKWLGINASKSSGSLLMEHKGREFNVASIFVSNVINSSLVILWVPMDLKINDLVDLTPASHKPPKWGAEGGLKNQVIWSFDKWLRIRCW